LKDGQRRSLTITLYQVVDASPLVWLQQTGKKHMLVRLPVGDEAIDLLHCHRPEWALTRPSTLAVNLDVRLPVPVGSVQVEVGDLKLRCAPSTASGRSYQDQS